MMQDSDWKTTRISLLFLWASALRTLTHEKGGDFMFHTKQWNQSRGNQIQKYDLEKKNGAAIALYDEAQKSGNWDKYIMFIWSSVEQMAFAQIHKNHFLKAVDIEDLISGAKVQVIEKIKEYDPRVSMPTSFFSIQIDQGLKDAVLKESKMSDHYHQVKARCEKIATKYGFTGLDDPRLTPDKIAKLSGESIKTINAMLKLSNITTTTLTDAEKTENKSGDFRDPSLILIEKDGNELLSNAFQSLSPYEQYIVAVRHGLYNPLVDSGPFAEMDEEELADLETDGETDPEAKEKHSWKRLERDFKNPEIREKLGITEKKTIRQIQDDERRAIRKVYNYEGIQALFGKKRNSGAPRTYREYEQAPAKVILSAIAEDVKAL